MRATHLRAGVLDVAYHERGPTDGPVVVLLHGFPYDASACLPAAERLALAGRRVVVPYLRGFGPTRFLAPQTPRVGQQAALALDLIALLDALHVGQAVLAGYDWGGRAACAVAALWPDRVAGLVTCGGYNIQDSGAQLTPAAPTEEHAHWYWYYLASARGAKALRTDRDTLCRFFWTSWSPSWDFSDTTFQTAASSFHNPDFCAVVLHSYRFRIGDVAGDPDLSSVERALAARPTITPPTVVLAGEDDRVDPPRQPEANGSSFAHLKDHQVLTGVGHNLPQEAPDAFADAILGLGRGDEDGA